VIEDHGGTHFFVTGTLNSIFKTSYIKSTVGKNVILYKNKKPQTLRVDLHIWRKHIADFNRYK
jgi:hypothetical protein